MFDRNARILLVRETADGGRRTLPGGSSGCKLPMPFMIRARALLPPFGACRAPSGPRMAELRPPLRQSRRPCRKGPKPMCAPDGRAPTTSPSTGTFSIGSRSAAVNRILDLAVFRSDGAKLRHCGMSARGLYGQKLQRAGQNMLSRL